MSDAPVSNTDGFLSRDACASSTKLNRPILSKQFISTWKTMNRRQYFFQALIQFSQEYKVLDAAASNIDCFLWRDTCISSTHMN
jgi:hypothetical protein